jgi:dihydrofolate reductase
MRKLILKMSMTLDGYVAGPEGEMDWAARTAHPDGKAWVAKTMEEAGAHVLGRCTYTDFVGVWPSSPDPLAPLMNEIPKVVFTHSGKLDRDTPTAPGWENPRVLGTDLTADIQTLKAEPGKDLLVQGGVTFARSLVQRNLIDEYRLVVHPVILGAGQSLFEDAPAFDLDLIDTVTFPSGTQALTYRPK